MAAGTTLRECESWPSPCQARVGHGDDALVGVDRAKRVIRRLRLPGARDGVEEGGFAYVRETDDACA